MTTAYAPTTTVSSRERALVPTLILVGLVVAVMSSLGAPLIPSIATASHVSLSAGEWLLTITLLTGALATPIMGRLADGPHQRRVIVSALSVVLAARVLAAVTSNFSVLVVARGAAGARPRAHARNHGRRAAPPARCPFRRDHRDAVGHCGGRCRTRLPDHRPAR